MAVTWKQWRDPATGATGWSAVSDDPKAPYQSQFNPVPSGANVTSALPPQPYAPGRNNSYGPVNTTNAPGYPFITGGNQADKEREAQIAAANALAAIYAGMGKVPGTAIPGFENSLYQKARWIKIPLPKGTGFSVYSNISGQTIGAYRAQDPQGSEFDAGGNYISSQNRLPSADMAEIGGQDTWKTEYERRQLDNAAAATAANIHNTDVTAGTSRYNTDITAGTNRYNTDQNNANAMARSQLDNETTRLRDGMQNAYNMGNLAEAQEYHRALIVNDQRKIALDEAKARAEMSANPTNWVANAYFLRNMAAPAGSLAFGSPGSEAVFGQNTTPGNVDMNNVPFMQALRGERPVPAFGQTISGTNPIGISVPGGSQVNYKTFNNLNPSEQQMSLGAVKATGQDPNDWLNQMRRAAPLGGQRSVQRFSY